MGTKPLMFLAAAIWLLLMFEVCYPEEQVVHSKTYIVQMDLSTMPKVFSSHIHWYSSVFNSAISSGNSKLIYTYTNSIDGFTAELSPTQLKTIQSSHGFLSSTEDIPIFLATTHSSDFLSLNSMSGAWPTSNFGEDIIIGVVDSGVWPESKSFSDQGITTKIPGRWKGGCYGGIDFNTSMCNKKLIGVRYFNEGFKSRYPNDAVQFLDSARDSKGHGTHVSSIAAGNFVQGASYFGYAAGTSKGMAPRARLAMYKVAATLSGKIISSDVLAAIDAAIEDGIDILSLSIGGFGQLIDNPLAAATFSAIQKSIFVSTAAGNSGPSFGTIPDSGAPWLLTVGAATTDRSFIGTISLANGVYLTGVSLNSLQPILQDLPITYIKKCQGDQEGHGNSKVIVCTIKDPNFDNFIGLLSPLNGTTVLGAVLIWHNLKASYLPDLPGDVIHFPAVVVNAANGRLILDYIKTSKDPKATLWFKATSHGIKPAPKVAAYSSRGPSLVCPFILKPDVIAPGHYILASWPETKPLNLETMGSLKNRFALESGTSMASPHVAGVAALVKAVHPDWSPTAIKSAIMTTSDVLDNTMAPIKEMKSNLIATPLAIGSGHINPNKALDPGLVYEAGVVDYVSLLCAMNFTSKQLLTITRSRPNCSKSSLDLNYPSFMAYFNGIPLCTAAWNELRFFLYISATTFQKSDFILPL